MQSQKFKPSTGRFLDLLSPPSSRQGKKLTASVITKENKQPESPPGNIKQNTLALRYGKEGLQVKEGKYISLQPFGNDKDNKVRSRPVNSWIPISENLTFIFITKYCLVIVLSITPHPILPFYTEEIVFQKKNVVIKSTNSGSQLIAFSYIFHVGDLSTLRNLSGCQSLCL